MLVRIFVTIVPPPNICRAGRIQSRYFYQPAIERGSIMYQLLLDETDFACTQVQCHVSVICAVAKVDLTHNTQDRAHDN